MIAGEGGPKQMSSTCMDLNPLHLSPQEVGWDQDLRASAEGVEHYDLFGLPVSSWSGKGSLIPAELFLRNRC